jgi:CheY-like chemotaxis protein
MTTVSLAARPVVLVVEDEPLLRLAAMDMVEDAGFEAVAATDATEAVRILEERTDIRIVFTDVDMPRGMDGMRLAVAIRDRWPPIEIILTSGYTMPADVDLPARAVFFPKPYREEQIVAELRRMAA